jgi:hypothetical protein
MLYLGSRDRGIKIFETTCPGIGNGRQTWTALACYDVLKGQTLENLFRNSHLRTSSMLIPSNEERSQQIPYHLPFISETQECTPECSCNVTPVCLVTQQPCFRITMRLLKTIGNKSSPLLPYFFSLLLHQDPEQRVTQQPDCQLIRYLRTHWTLYEPKVSNPHPKADQKTKHANPQPHHTPRNNSHPPPPLLRRTRSPPNPRHARRRLPLRHARLGRHEPRARRLHALRLRLRRTQHLRCLTNDRSREFRA